LYEWVALGFTVPGRPQKTLAIKKDAHRTIIQVEPQSVFLSPMMLTKLTSARPARNWQSPYRLRPSGQWEGL
jgi:hypothetical protein